MDSTMPSLPRWSHWVYLQTISQQVGDLSPTGILAGLQSISQARTPSFLSPFILEMLEFVTFFFFFVAELKLHDHEVRVMMAQGLEALASLAESQVQFPAPTCRLTAICNSSGRRYNIIFWLPGAPGTHMVHTHTYTRADRQSVHRHKIKQNKTHKQTNERIPHHNQGNFRKNAFILVYGMR